MENVLVLQAARIGDLLQTRRLVLSLGQKHRVHLGVDRSLVPFARYIFPDLPVYGLAFHHFPDAEALAACEGVFGLWRSQHFARVYNCNFSPLTESVCHLFDSEQVVGYRPLRHTAGGAGKSPWLRLAFRLARNRQITPLNLVDMWANLADMPIDPARVNPIAQKGGGGAGVCLAGREERRSLPLAALAKIVELLTRLYPASKVKLFGGSEQQAASARLLRLLEPAARRKIDNLCGKTTLPEAAEELRGLDIFISPDTGLMHLAAFMGVPVLAYFLSSAWAHETGPYGTGHIVWQGAASCSPCLESAECNNNLACGRAFMTSDFVTATGRILAGKIPAGIDDSVQIWRTSLDGLGAKLDLAAGKDNMLPARNALRKLVAEYLRLETDWSNDDCPQNELEQLARLVWPDDEWMLPPWRYC